MSDPDTDLQKTTGQPPAEYDPAEDTAVAVSRHEKALLKGDLSDLTKQERAEYFGDLCDSLGLNPLTKPFEYIYLNGELSLYANKSAAAQLRKNHRVSITDVEEEQKWGLYIAKVKAKTPDGRVDRDEGSVPVEDKTGEALANARMKAITKAKRRVTLSICGLGFLDETEAESAGQKADVDPHTGEITGGGGSSDDVNEALGLGNGGSGDNADEDSPEVPEDEEDPEEQPSVSRYGQTLTPSNAAKLDNWDQALAEKEGDELRDGLEAAEKNLAGWPESVPKSLLSAYNTMLAEHRKRLDNEEESSDEPEGTPLPEGEEAPAGRNYLISAGVDTVEKLRGHVVAGTLQDQDGIGKITATNARQWVQNRDDE